MRWLICADCPKSSARRRKVRLKRPLTVFILGILRNGHLLWWIAAFPLAVLVILFYVGCLRCGDYHDV